MSILTLTVSLFHGKHMALALKEWFETEAMQEGDTFVSLARTGLLRWQLTYHLAEDGLSQKQYQWILLHIDMLVSARFHTEQVGFVGKMWGAFTMTMKR